VVVADGTPAFALAPDGTSPRTPASPAAGNAGKSALLDALRGGGIEAIARAEIGNRDAAADGT